MEKKNLFNKKKIIMKKIIDKIKENFNNDEMINEIKTEIINPLYKEIKYQVYPYYIFFIIISIIILLLLIILIVSIFNFNKKLK